MATARIERRLAAIMATDIVGYSSLIERDEARTLASIRAIRAEVINPVLESHKGRVAKLMGEAPSWSSVRSSMQSPVRSRSSRP